MNSVEIAKATNKLHKNVLRDIRVLINNGAFEQCNITLSAYKDKIGKSNPMYILDKKSTDILMAIKSKQGRPPLTTLYLIKGWKLTKIGITHNIQKRLITLRRFSPVPLKLLFKINKPNADKLENHLHIKYKDKHSHGEWYNLTEDDIKNIKEEVI